MLADARQRLGLPSAEEEAQARAAAKAAAQAAARPNPSFVGAPAAPAPGPGGIGVTTPAMAAALAAIAGATGGGQPMPAMPAAPVVDARKRALDQKKKLLWGRKKEEVEGLEAQQSEAHANKQQWRAAQFNGNAAEKARFLKMMGDKAGASAAEQQQKQAAAAEQEQPAAPAGSGESDGATRVLAFNHGYPRDTLMDAAEVALIKDDIRGEAERVGDKTLAIELPTPTGAAEAIPGIGFVFIAFASIDGARKAHFALNGRAFNHQQVACVSPDSHLSRSKSSPHSAASTAAAAQHYYEELKFARGEPGRLLTSFLTGLRFTDGGTVLSQVSSRIRRDGRCWRRASRSVCGTSSRSSSRTG